MKIILSRKGFDSGYGGQASPILPNGALLSFPIPNETDRNRYSELMYDGRSYSEIIHGLNPNPAIGETCHLDPDIRTNVIRRGEGWMALFGQCDTAQTHLANQGVGIGDLFLFFGWFRKAEMIGDTYQYETPVRELQAIYGYLQIGNIYRNYRDLPEYAVNHPHARYFADYDGENPEMPIANNCVYEARETLSWDHSKKGWGCLKYTATVTPSVILTAEGERQRTHWNLPDCLRNENITYHSENSWRAGYFQSVAKGQEFVIGDIESGVSPAVETWAKAVIAQNYDENAEKR